MDDKFSDSHTLCNTSCPVQLVEDAGFSCVIRGMIYDCGCFFSLKMDALAYCWRH